MIEGSTNSVGKFGNPNVRLTYPSDGKKGDRLGSTSIKSMAYKQRQTYYTCTLTYQGVTIQLDLSEYLVQ